jgi:hypothetical protein
MGRRDKRRSKKKKADKRKEIGDAFKRPVVSTRKEDGKWESQTESLAS